MPFDFTTDPRPKIAMSLVDIDPSRIRSEYTNILELKDSIERLGLMQPIVVSRLPDSDRLKLIAGMTRFKACLLIPAMKGQIPYSLYEECNDLQRKEMELEENVRRKDLTDFEKLDALVQIDELKRKIHGDKNVSNPLGWSGADTAKLAGVSQATVSQQLTFAKKIRERSDLKERLSKLPVSVGMRVLEQIEEGEKVKRLAETGQLKLSESLVNLDALTFLKTIPDNSVDLVVTDPPYGQENLGLGKDTSDNSGYTYSSTQFAEDNLTRPQALELLTGVAKELFRVLKPGAHCYVFFTLQLHTELDAIWTAARFNLIRPVLIWDKGRPTTAFSGFSYPPAYECIQFMSKTTLPRRLQETCTSVLRFPPVQGTVKTHPFEKPKELLSKLISNSSLYGELVLDPFAGSASTLIVAKQLGRRVTGSELNPEHFHKAQAALISSTSPEALKPIGVK